MDASGRVVTDGAAPAGSPGRGRDSLFLSAQVRFAGETTERDGRVRNLSPGGLMLELDRVVEPGTAVALTVRGLGELTGQVAWCTRGRLGIALDRPIDPKRARKPVGQGAATPDYAKPLVARAPRR